MGSSTYCDVGEIPRRSSERICSGVLLETVRRRTTTVVYCLPIHLLHFIDGPVVSGSCRTIRELPSRSHPQVRLTSHSCFLSWVEMLNERELLPLWAHIPPPITLVTLIATRPPLLIRLALTALGTYQFYALLSRYTTGDGPMHDYSMGGAIHQYLVALYLFVWLCDPLKEWRYKGQEAAPAEYPLLRRLYYTACIVCNARLIGWSSQVRSEYLHMEGGVTMIDVNVDDRLQHR